MRLINFLCAFFCVVAAVVMFADIGWQMYHAGVQKYLDHGFLETQRGWESIRGDHPVVRRRPFRMGYVVLTDDVTYITNLSLDPTVEAELGRLAVQ